MSDPFAGSRSRGLKGSMSTGTAGDDDAASMMSMKGKKSKGKKSKGKKGPSGDYDDDGPPPAPTAIAGNDDALAGDDDAAPSRRRRRWRN